MPDYLWRKYSKHASDIGLCNLYFVLSFDCDIDEDARVVWDVHSRLSDMGVTPVYAVPGELLNRSEKIYHQIFDNGAEFINHGYREHTYYNTESGDHASCFFYDELPFDLVREDIILGDLNLRKTLGVSPSGFRAPHFGTFQRLAQLKFQHSVLRELGYSYSASTVPLYAYRYGPAFRDFGVIELPLSGMGSRPLRILDSWTCFRAPARRFSPQDYLIEAKHVAENFQRAGVGILNFYADPSHIYDRPEFFDAVACWASIARPVTYSQLLSEIA